MDKQQQLTELLAELPRATIRDAFNDAVTNRGRSDLKLTTEFEPVDEYCKNDANVKTYWGLCLDVETTGLDKENDHITELGLVAFEFDQEGLIYRIKRIYNGFEQPPEPISEFVTNKTGITNEMVRGQRFDDALVNRAFSMATLVIAHNASFDRPMVERRFPQAEQNHWGCSYKDVDWEEEGLDSQKLGHIMAHFGYKFTGHRAEIDVLATIHILSQTLASTGETALVSLLDTIRTPSYHVYAYHTDFDKKDTLAARGYRWFPGDSSRQKCWNKAIEEAELDDELLFLRETIYPGRKRDVFAVERLGSLNRYSSRGGDTVRFDEDETAQSTPNHFAPNKQEDKPKGLRRLSA